MCENNNLNNDTIDETFCENMANLSKELEQPTKKEKILFVVRFILIMITIFTILTFYQYPDINYWIKWVSTIALIVLYCVVSYKEGLENGLSMGRKYVKAKDELHDRMVERMVRMIREKIENGH